MTVLFRQLARSRPISPDLAPPTSQVAEQATQLAALRRQLDEKSQEAKAAAAQCSEAGRDAQRHREAQRQAESKVRSPSR